jgi:hypothetical protein
LAVAGFDNELRVVLGSGDLVPFDLRGTCLLLHHLAMRFAAVAFQLTLSPDLGSCFILRPP